MMNGALSPVNGAVKSVHTYLTMHVLSIFANSYILSVNAGLIIHSHF